MSEPAFSHEQLLRDARLRPEDTVEIRKRRRDNNHWGFAYQLAFIRLLNRFSVIGSGVLLFRRRQLCRLRPGWTALQRERLGT